MSEKWLRRILPKTPWGTGSLADTASIRGSGVFRKGALSADFDFVRVDFYATPTEIRVGELTFFPESASGKLEPPEAEFTLGAYFSDDSDC